METPMLIEPEKKWCGGGSVCSACGLCGPTPAVFIEGAALAAVVNFVK